MSRRKEADQRGHIQTNSWAHSLPSSSPSLHRLPPPSALLPRTSNCITTLFVPSYLLSFPTFSLPSTSKHFQILLGIWLSDGGGFQSDRHDNTAQEMILELLSKLIAIWPSHVNQCAVLRWVNKRFQSSWGWLAHDCCYSLRCGCFVSVPPTPTDWGKEASTFSLNTVWNSLRNWVSLPAAAALMSGEWISCVYFLCFILTCSFLNGA